MTRPTTLYVWLAFLAFAALSVGLAVYGWAVALGLSWQGLTLLQGVDVAYRTIILFFAGAPAGGLPADSLALRLAGTLAPLVTAGAVFRVALEFFATKRTRMRLARLRNHTVVCGGTANARAFAESEARRREPVVLIDGAADETVRNFARVHGVDLLEGDPADPAVLAAVNVGAARRLIVCAGDDNRNIDIAMFARAAVSPKRSVERPLLANVEIEERALWREIMGSDTVKRMEGAFQMLPFNLSAWAARAFTWSEPLVAYAYLRGAERIHAVFVGYDDFAEAFIGQLPPTCIAPGLERMRLSVLAPDPKLTEARVLRAYPQLSETADIAFHAFDPLADRLDAERMRRLAKPAHPTAIFVCQPDDKTGLRDALALQDAMIRTGAWEAPIFVRLSKCEGVRTLLKDSAHAKRLHQVIQAFGVQSALCDLAVIEGRLEELAQAFHTGYLETRKGYIGYAGDARSGDTLAEWRKLPETFRSSNRRAADHIPAKLLAAGCIGVTDRALTADPSFGLADAATLEELAALEHDSWNVGRWMDGWRFGEVRDDRRKRHPNITSYTSLDEQTKAFDRRQLQLLDSDLIRRKPHFKRPVKIRHDHWLGLIGKNVLEEAEADWLREKALPETLRRLTARDQAMHVTLVTALAPGSDLILTQGALRYLSLHDVPHRLLIIETVPDHWVLQDYKAMRTPASVWSGVPAETADWSEIEKDIKTARAEIAAHHRTEWILDFKDFEADFSDPAIRQEGYRKAAEYIAHRTNTLVAACRNEEDPVAKPGGVAHTLGVRAKLADRSPDSARFRRYPATCIRLNLDTFDVTEGH